MNRCDRIGEIENRPWHQALTKLKDFIKKRPEIQLTPHVTAIPENVRAEFYRLFNLVRTSFLAELLPDLSHEIMGLKINYDKIHDDVKRQLGLEEIFIAQDLQKFMDDADGRLTQEIFELLFNLINKEIDNEKFESQAVIRLNYCYRTLYRGLYHKWIALSLIKLLKANRNFKVDVPPIELSARGPKIMLDAQPVPKPQESKRLSFYNDTAPAFIAPDFIIYSPWIRQFVAFKSDLGRLDITAEVMWRASSLSEDRAWFDLRALQSFWRCSHTLELQYDFILYFDDNIEDISLIADSEKICRPDLILVCIDRDDSLLAKALEREKLYKNFLKPKYGVALITMTPSP